MTGGFQILLTSGALLLMLCSMTIGVGHTQGQSVHSLIELLTYQSGRQWHPNGVVTCGSLYQDTLENRRVADSLVNLGDVAVPELQGALDSVLKEGETSRFVRNAGFLGYAYAKLKGPSAYPLLRTLINRAGLESLRQPFANSVSVAFGLTSYVDSSITPNRGGCRAPEPRDALNQLLAAWLRGDRRQFESSIGPQGKAALRGLLDETSWTATREKLLHSGNTGHVALGYTLRIGGRWSQPEGTAQAEAPIDLAQYPRNPEVDTHFSDGSGKPCGDYTLRFRRVESDFLPKYEIDNSNLGTLLRMISACATDVRNEP
jgi:hypothetical protein